MEDLYSTTLNVKEQRLTFHVFFDQEKYVFTPEGHQSSERFFLKREGDVWKGAESADANMRMQAIETLEKYLLKQH